MKKIALLSLILVLVSSSVQAHKWAYVFVVWDGKVYEVIEEEMIEESEIGKSIKIHNHLIAYKLTGGGK